MTLQLLTMESYSISISLVYSYIMCTKSLILFTLVTLVGSHKVSMIITGSICYNKCVKPYFKSKFILRID